MEDVIAMNKVEDLLLRLQKNSKETFMTSIYSLSSAWLVGMITYLYNKYNLKKNSNVSELRSIVALLTTLMTVYIGRYATGPHYFGKRLKRRRSKRVSRKHR